MKNIIVFGVMLAICVFIYVRQQDEAYYDLLIVSGATPLAVAKKVPSSISLTVSGLIKKEYIFGGDALNAFATTRIRTREFSAAGDYQGAYAYLGIPVFNILEGISPQKPNSASFRQPLDMMVSFISKSGKRSNFSYNEIIMTSDQFPITLAYDRVPLEPTNEAALTTYQYNRYKENLTGLRLICPKEPDTVRYLDDVVRIVYSVPPAPDERLPVRKKPFKCESRSLRCIDGAEAFRARFDNVTLYSVPRWVRIGHGHGFEEVVTASGYHLPSFLKQNFPGCADTDFFLFVACDGYRCLFSGREIFSTPDGQHMMIVNNFNGDIPEAGFMLGPTGDFFSDRAMWGLSCVARIEESE